MSTIATRGVLELIDLLLAGSILAICMFLFLMVSMTVSKIRSLIISYFHHE